MPRVTALLLDSQGPGEPLLAATLAQTRPPDQIVRAGELPPPTGAASVGRRSFGGWVDVLLASRGATASGGTTNDQDVNDQNADDGPPDAGPADAGPPDDDCWLWLLDITARPDPSCLQRLLAAVETAPSVAVAGCKQVSLVDDALLIDVGFTTSPAGAVVTGIELNEVDQGQYDDRSDIMAVKLVGALVRERVWREVSAPTATLDESAAALEFCRRVRLAGHRVVVVPKAVVARHPPSPATRMDRASAIHVKLVRARWWLLFPLLVWLLVAAPFRALWRLLIKQPRRALRELTAPVRAVCRPRLWWRARRSARRVRRVPRDTLSRLDATRSQVWRQRRDDLMAFVFWTPALAAPATDSAPDGSPRGDDEGRPRGRFADQQGTPSSRRRAAGLTGAVALAAVFGLIALRRALPWGAVDGATGLTGPALLPAPETWRELWQLFATSWRPTGLGMHAIADPLSAVLGGMALLAGGSARVAVDVLVLGALPLSALTAWLAAGALTRSVALRCWAALAWAAAPSLLVAVGDGRLGAVLAHVVLPLFVLALARSVGYGESGRASLTAAAGAGLAATVVIAGAPSLAAPVVVLLLVAVLAARAARWLPLLIAAIPVVLLWPWWVAVASAPRLLLADPSSPSAAGPSAPASFWHLVGLPLAPSTLIGGADGEPRQWLAAHLPFSVAGISGPSLAEALIVAGLVALAGLVAMIGLFGRRYRLVAIALGIGLIGVEVAVIAARVDVGAIEGGNVRGWTGPGVSWFTLGVLLGAVAAARGLRHSKILRPLGAVLAVLPLLLLAGWAWHGWSEGVGVQRVSPDTIPEVSALEAASPAATRTLVVRLDPATPPGFSWAVQRFPGPRLGADSTDAAQQRLAGTTSGGGSALSQTRETDLVTPLVGTLLSDSGEDVREQLAALAIGSIQMLPPLDDQAVLSLDSSPGLVRSGRVDGSLVWRVDLPSAAGEVTRPARARLVNTKGAVEGTVASAGTRVEGDLPAGDKGRRVVLAERADTHWRATFNGVALKAEVYDGWAVAFTVPATAGHLVVDVPPSTATSANWARAVVLLLIVLLAIPVPRLRRRVGAPPRASRAVPRVNLDERHGARPRGAELGSEEAAQRWADFESEVEVEPDDAQGDPEAELAGVGTDANHRLGESS